MKQMQPIIQNDSIKDIDNELFELIKINPVAMMCSTINKKICAKPMFTLTESTPQHILFLSLKHSFENLTQLPLTLCYADNTQTSFACVNGIAHIKDDRDKIQKFWKDEFYQWFAFGPSDPELILLEVEIKEYEIWKNFSLNKSPSSQKNTLIDSAKRFNQNNPTSAVPKSKSPKVATTSWATQNTPQQSANALGKTESKKEMSDSNHQSSQESNEVSAAILSEELTQG